jgi:hypothetical protein
LYSFQYLRRPRCAAKLLCFHIAGGFESHRLRFLFRPRGGTNAGPRCLPIGDRENARPGLHRLMQLPRLIGRISNPQPNQRIARPCATCAVFGNPRNLLSSCKTSQPCPVTVDARDCLYATAVARHFIRAPRQASSFRSVYSVPNGPADKKS